MVDITAFKEALQAFGLVMTLAKQAKDLIPEGPQKQAFAASLENAERQIAIAEAQAAVALGYELCHCDFPPAIMLWNEEQGHWNCPKCGAKRSPPKLGDPFSTPSKWHI